MAHGSEDFNNQNWDDLVEFPEDAFVDPNLSDQDNLDFNPVQNGVDFFYFDLGGRRRDFQLYSDAESVDFYLPLSQSNSFSTLPELFYSQTATTGSAPACGNDIFTEFLTDQSTTPSSSSQLHQAPPHHQEPDILTFANRITAAVSPLASPLQTPANIVGTAPSPSSTLQFQCADCPKKYKTRNNLMRHRRTVGHSPRTPSVWTPITCTYPSPEADSSSSSSSPHITLVDQTVKILYDCPHPKCSRKGEKGFPRKDNMVQHQRLVHDAKIEKRDRTPKEGAKKKKAPAA